MWVVKYGGDGFFPFAKDNTKYPVEKALCHLNEIQEEICQVLSRSCLSFCKRTSTDKLTRDEKSSFVHMTKTLKIDWRCDGVFLLQKDILSVPE